MMGKMEERLQGWKDGEFLEIWGFEDARILGRKNKLQGLGFLRCFPFDPPSLLEVFTPGNNCVMVTTLSSIPESTD